MYPIYILWAVPRSTSTAFEWMMRQRGDLQCFHEPFGEAWYQGENPLWPNANQDSVRTMGLTLESAWEALKQAAKQNPVFTKDFPHYIKTINSTEILSRSNHSFLIRDPAKTISSLYKHAPDFHADEAGFREQRELFDKLCDQFGTPPPVLDSDDLLANPEKMVALWCDAIGIPFMQNALSWEPGARDEVSWWDGGSFHENLRNSDGLKPQPIKHADIRQVSDRAKQIYQDILPHYQHLYQYRLKA